MDTELTLKLERLPDGRARLIVEGALKDVLDIAEFIALENIERNDLVE